MTDLDALAVQVGRELFQYRGAPPSLMRSVAAGEQPGPRVVISSPVYPTDSWWVKMDDCRAMARTEVLARLAALLRSMIEEEGK